MAFRKLMLLPLAALLFAGVVVVRAAEVDPEPATSSEEQSVKDAVNEQLQEGEAALQQLLGPEVHTLDKMLKPLLEEMAKAYGVSETELAVVAKEVMQKIASMDMDVLQGTLTQLAGLGGLNPNDATALQELLGRLGSPVEADGI